MFNLSARPMAWKLAKRPGGTFTNYNSQQVPITSGVMNFGMCDGSVRSIPVKIDQYPTRPMYDLIIDPTHNLTW